MKSQVKKVISIILIVAMTIINDGLMVFANNIDENNNVSGEVIVNEIVLNGIIIYVYSNGEVKDNFGNIYNLDGSVTLLGGTTYYKNGDVKDATGVIYHIDGSITLPNGATRDVNGITHYEDGSITLLDGTIFLADGRIILPGEMQLDQQVYKTTQEETLPNINIQNFWNYDPASDNWKFEKLNADGTKTIYKDQWVVAKNAQGKDTWYAVDSEGNMIIGWLKSDGEYYFLSDSANSRGELVKGTVTIDGQTYVFDSDTGALKEGKVPTKNFKVLGATNHISGIDGAWKTYTTGERYFVFYFSMPDGSTIEVPPSKWFMVDGDYYYFDQYGIPETGLIIYADKYYYFKEDGKMQEGGEVTIGDTTYVFDKATGACRTMRQN